MKDKYNLEELVNKVNKILEEDRGVVQDGRISSSLTIRRLRDYISKGLVSKGERDGKFMLYDDTHIQEILDLRKLQISGYTDKTLSNLRTTLSLSAATNSNPDSLSAQSLIGSIRDREAKAIYENCNFKMFIKNDEILDSEGKVKLSFPFDYDFNKNGEELKANLNKLIMKKTGDQCD